jgi:hypothetical protein
MKHNLRVTDIGNLQGLRMVTGHDHFGAFFSRPSDHEDRRPRLRAWEREGYAMWKTSSSPIPEGHLMCQMVEKKSMGGEMSFRPLVRPHHSFTSR